MAVEEGGALGPYRLLRRLGGGGAGEVYLGEGVAGVPLGPGPVAIKVIAGSAADPAVQHIARVAQAAGRLQQPHIIPFYGVVEDLDRLATVMAFAGAGSLGDNLQMARAGVNQSLGLPLGPPIVARLVSQIGAALEVAHGAGLVHGDLKPTNVFVRTSPTGHPLATVSDFGQSVVVGAAASILAAQGSSSSPSMSVWAASQLLFAAPEQLDGLTTPASDQYGLAALAYLLVTGVPPIVGSGYALLQLVRAGTAAPPSRQNRALGAATDEALLRALSRDPSQRFPTLGFFVETLRNSLVSASATGVTNQFAMLAGEQYTQLGQGELLPAHAPREAPESMFAQDSRSSSRARVGSRWLGRKPGAGGIPDPSPTLNKRLAIMTAAALLVAVVSCFLAVQAINATSFLPHIILGNASSAVATPIVPTPNAAQLQIADQAVKDLRLATSNHHIFADPLTNNNNHWRTSDKTLYFASDGFHISTFSSSSGVGDNAPGTVTSPSNVVVQVDIKFTQAQAGNFAGLRFFVTQKANGTQNYYCFLISIDGRFAVWEYQGDDRTPWTFIAAGYGNGIKSGLNQTNRLAILALGQGAQRRTIFFANGQYVAQIPMGDSTIATSGGSGLMVFDENTQAVFSNFALYDAGNLS